MEDDDACVKKKKNTLSVINVKYKINDFIKNCILTI